MIRIGNDFIRLLSTGSQVKNGTIKKEDWYKVLKGTREDAPLMKIITSIPFPITLLHRTDCAYPS